MNKRFKLMLGLSTLFGIGLAGVGFDRTEPISTEAVSSTRVYVKITQEIKDRATAFRIHLGTGSDQNLTLLPNSDAFTYYVDAPVNTGGNITFKHNSSQSFVGSINLYNIPGSGYGTTWDTISWKGTISNWNAPASTSNYDKVVYTPPGAQYSVSLYNGVTLIGTQTAFENVVFTPSNISVTDHVFLGWYTDSSLTIPYTPTVFTSAGSLYGKYEPIDMNRSVRFYVEGDSASNNWYENSSVTRISYWKQGVTPIVKLMRREPALRLDSVVIENASFTHMRLFKIVNGNDVWNQTGDIQINLTMHEVTKFSGQVNNGITSLTPSEYKTTAADIVYLKTEVPLLTCTNYGAISTIKTTFDRLGDNEKDVSVLGEYTASDTTKMSYQAVIDYYVGWKAANATPPGLLNVVARSDDDNSMLLITIGALAISMFGYFIILRKRKIA